MSAPARTNTSVFMIAFPSSGATANSSRLQLELRPPHHAHDVRLPMVGVCIKDSHTVARNGQTAPREIREPGEPPQCVRVPFNRRDLRIVIVRSRDEEY